MNEQSQSQSSAQGDCFCGGAGPRFTARAREVRMNATAEHFRNAGVEILKGLRTILDTGIDRLTRDPNARGTTVNVD